jgi:hypothetical protein
MQQRGRGAVSTLEKGEEQGADLQANFQQTNGWKGRRVDCRGVINLCLK